MKELVGESQSFIVANRRYIFEYLRPYLFLLIGFEAAASIGSIYSESFGIFRLLSAYLYGCFFLSWLRAVMKGPDAAHAVQPFALKPGEGRLILWSIWATGLPLLAGGAAGIFIGIAGAFHPERLIPMMVLAVPLIVYSFLLSARLMFTLPGRAVGKPVTYQEGKQLARGLIWKLIGAGTLWAVLLFVAIFIWAGLLGVIFYGSGGIDPMSFAGSVINFLSVGLPAAAANIIIIALTATILGRLYQCSVRQGQGLSGS